MEDESKGGTRTPREIKRARAQKAYELRVADYQKRMMEWKESEGYAECPWCKMRLKSPIRGVKAYVFLCGTCGWKQGMPVAPEGFQEFLDRTAEEQINELKSKGHNA